MSVKSFCGSRTVPKSSEFDWDFSGSCPIEFDATFGELMTRTNLQASLSTPSILHTMLTIRLTRCVSLSLSRC